MSPRYRFGRFELCPETRQLFERGACAAVGGRAFDLLLALVERAGRTVPRDELYELVWPGLAVEPNNLHVQVWALRGLLGRDAIATVARRGYRFTPEVEVVGAGSHARSNSTPATRIEVLPVAARGSAELSPTVDLVAACLRRHRLLTLVGDDDAALTITAEAAVHALRPALDGGVWHLDPVTLARTWPGDPAASRHESGSAPLPGGLGRLLDRLATRDALFVVAGCHRAAGPAQAAVRATLARAPAVRVLASSRAPLGLPGEHVLRFARR